jgi:hypothetical protein
MRFRDPNYSVQRATAMPIQCRLTLRSAAWQRRRGFCASQKA